MGKSSDVLPISSPCRALCAALLAVSAGLMASSGVSAQSISTSIQVPPLQWINLTGLLKGPAPPPLKDASIGYDETSRSLVIFGGESAQGIPQAQTYLLDLSTLTWSTPSPPSTLQQQPPARSGAISAQDSAASYRTGHVIFGGRGLDGQLLSDVWEYSFNAQFWTQVQVSGDNSPSARWAAAGGNDIRASTVQDPRFPTPNNSFYVAGGFDSKGAISLSDLWQFNLTGTLSSNLPNSVVGSWEKLSLSNSSLPSIGGSATTALFQSPNQFISAIGGCDASSGSSASCALNSTYTLNLGASNGQSISTCPAPRIGASLAPNMNGASSTFNSQVFQILGTFDSSQWQDDGGLAKGEVDVFNIQTGQWARILPAGDPANGQVSFPTPREGAVAVSYFRALVGPETSRDSATDTIVFGGRDASNNYLQEVWMLRAYNGVITQSNQHWSGYGSGNLQTGVGANGEGVTISYMSKCASFIGKATSTSSTSATSSISGQPSPTNGQPASPSDTGVTPALPINRYDTSTTHKVLAPVSVAVALPAALIYRLSLAPIITSLQAASGPALVLLAAVLASSSFAIGIAGLAIAFTSITYNTSLTKRSSVPVLPTAHAKAGIALFAGMYVVFAVTLCLAVWRGWRSFSGGRRRSVMRSRTMSNDMAEKVGLYQGRAASPGPPEPAAQAQPRAQSSDHSSGWPFFGFGTSRQSSESGSASAERTPSPSKHSFEVVNRPARARRASAHSLAAFSDPRGSTTAPHNLSDMSWVFPRRSSSRLDALDDGRRAPDPSTPGTAVMEIRSTKGLMSDASPPVYPELPSFLEASLHILLQAFLLALCVLCLIALWHRAPKATFIVFLVWTVGFYVLMFTLAWYGIPRVSVLSVLVNRLRTNPAARSQRDAATPDVSLSNGQGPYRNHPPYRATSEGDYTTSLSHAENTIDDYDDDEDDDTRQRRMEEEMGRRDVSIITVPKRKLVPKNPDPVPS